MIDGKARAVAVFLQAAPVLLGVPLYFAVFSAGGGMLVFFLPGVFMVIAGFAAALIVRLCSRPGFVRTEAAGSLRFHGIVGIVTVVLLILMFAGFFAGIMPAVSGGAMLFGVLLPLLEIARALTYGIGAARGPQAPPLPNR